MTSACETNIRGIHFHRFNSQVIKRFIEKNGLSTLNKNKLHNDVIIIIKECECLVIHPLKQYVSKPGTIRLRIQIQSWIQKL